MEKKYQDAFSFLMKIENDEHIKIYVNNHTFLKNIILYNIAPDDQSIYYNTYFHYKNFKKSLVALQKLDADQNVIKTQWASIGMSHSCEINGQIFHDKQRNDIQFQQTLQKVHEMLKNGSYIQIYKMKLQQDSTQVQITYTQKSWLITSNTYSTLVQYEKDAEYYPKLKFIVKSWFQLISTLQKQAESLAEDLADRTLIGQYFNGQFQFHAIQEHDSSFLVTLSETQNFLNHYKLPSPNFENAGNFFQIKDFQNFMIEQCDKISQGSININGQGYLIYFTNKKKIISHCAIRTVESKLYELVKKSLSNDTLDFQQQMRKICQHNRPPKPILFYTQLYRLAQKNIKNQKISWNQALTCLINCIDQEHKEIDDFKKYSYKPNYYKKNLFVLYPLWIKGLKIKPYYQQIQQQIRDQYSNAKLRIISKDEDDFYAQIQEEVGSLSKLDKFETIILAIEDVFDIENLKLSIQKVTSLEQNTWLKIWNIVIAPDDKGLDIKQNSYPFSFHTMMIYFHRLLPNNSNHKESIKNQKNSIQAFKNIEFGEGFFRQETKADGVFYFNDIRQNDDSMPLYSEILYDDFIEYMIDDTQKQQLLYDFLESLQYNQYKEEEIKNYQYDLISHLMKNFETMNLKQKDHSKVVKFHLKTQYSLNRNKYEDLKNWIFDQLEELENQYENDQDLKYCLDEIFQQWFNNGQKHYQESDKLNIQPLSPINEDVEKVQVKEVVLIPNHKLYIVLSQENQLQVQNAHVLILEKRGSSIDIKDAIKYFTNSKFQKITELEKCIFKIEGTGLDISCQKQ